MLEARRLSFEKSTWVAFAILAISAVATPAAAKTRVAVNTLAAPEELADLSAQLTEHLLIELGRSSELIVISESELKMLVKNAEDRAALTDCDTAESCFASVSQAAHAEKIMTGHVGTWGRGFIVTLKRSDVQRAVFEQGESCTADNREELFACATEAAKSLFGGGRSGPAFTLSETAAKTELAVLDLDAYDLSEGLAETLTQLMALELKRVPGVSVISRDEVKAMFQFEFDKQALKCESDMACLAEIGGAMGVDYLVAGGIGCWTRPTCSR